MSSGLRWLQLHYHVEWRPHCILAVSALAEIRVQHSRISLPSHASEPAPWAKEALNFRTQFSPESEKVGSKVFGVVAALDVIRGHNIG
jgi:hypothetical protein